jgi:response regulator RpfG family c-di-GMP phosphodiesterase
MSRPEYSDRLDPTLEARFQKDQGSLIRGRVNIILLMGILFVPLFGIIDYFLYPRHFATFMAYRLTSSAGCLVLYIINRAFKPGFKSYYLGVIAFYLVGLSLIKMVLDLGGFSTPYYAGLNLVFVGFCVVLPLDIRRTVLHCAVLYCIYVAAVFLFTPIRDATLFFANNSFVVSTLAIILIGSHTNYTLRRREYLLREYLDDLQRKLTAYSENLEGEVDEKHNALMEKVEELRSRQQLLAETQRATIFGLAKLAESRDRQTGEHLERMRYICRCLAEEMRISEPYRDLISEEFIANLSDSCALHDLGKVAIPDAILLKPGPLTGEEYERIKRHSAIGGETLKAIDELLGEESFIKMGYEIARFHHERYDGTGYPMGLKGDEIPLVARIVAVADVYDALTSNRCYKDACEPEEAARIIIDGRNFHFDPDVVDAFIRVKERLRKVMEADQEGKEDRRARRMHLKARSSGG